MVDKGWIEALIQLNAGAEKRKKDGLFFPCISEEPGFGEINSFGGGQRVFISSGSGGNTGSTISGWGGSRNSISSSLTSPHGNKSIGSNTSNGKSRRRN